jgi:hypothetical protein
VAALMLVIIKTGHRKQSTDSTQPNYQKQVVL